MELIMIKGLPASGKTQWAKKLQAEHPNVYKRINKDDLRAMLDDGKFSRDNETCILSVRDQLITMFLSRGLSVIVDDTNLDPKHDETLRSLARQCSADFSIQDFTQVPLETCLERDRQRANHAGEKDILSMYHRYLKSADRPRKLQCNPDLKDCYIFDVDGTLTLMNDRKPFEWDKVENDAPNEFVIRVYQRLKLGNPMAVFIILSGRDEVCRTQTMSWLAKHEIFCDSLFMRKHGDQRDDKLVKKEIYDEHIGGKCNVLGIFDDRPKIIRMWQSMGLPVFNVNGTTDYDF